MYILFLLSWKFSHKKYKWRIEILIALKYIANFWCLNKLFLNSLLYKKDIMKNSKAQIERSLKPNLRKNVVNILLSINSEITTKIDKIELLYLNSSSALL